MVERQVKTAHGTDRYVKSGCPIFLDSLGVKHVFDFSDVFV